MEDFTDKKERKMNKKEYDKEWYQKNRERVLQWQRDYYQRTRKYRLETQRKYYENNREKIIKDAAQWKKDNRERYKESIKKHFNSERGYFRTLWETTKRSGKHNSFKDFDDFFDHWLEQKKISGMKCPGTGVEMTTKAFFNKKGEFKTCQTNISKDRILNSMGYSHQNLIFTCWKYNNDKNAMTPKMAKAYLKIVKERYGTDDIE
jgi:exonuclease VII large subunit